MTQTQCTAGPAGSGPPAEPPPEVPRRPALSPSRANDFKQCPLLYRFRAIDRLPEVPGPAQARGTLVHAVLERLFLLPAEQRTPQAARALVAPAWAQLCADDPRLAAALFGGEAGSAARPDSPTAGPPTMSRRPRTRVRRSRAGSRAPSRCSTPTSPSRTRGCSNPRPGSCSSRSSWSRGCCCAATSTGSTGSTAAARTAPRSAVVDYKTGSAPRADRRGTRAVPDEVLRAGAAGACAG